MIVLFAAALAADGPPRDDAPCDTLLAWASDRAPTLATRPPTEWWLGEPPCPPGHDLIGAAPPRARDVSCTIGGRRSGPQTMFAEEGQVVLETHWARGVEIGPRTEWDRHTGKVLRIVPMAKGQRDGEVAEWSADGELVVTTWRRGVKSGPSFTVDATGTVTKVEFWRDDLRHGRSCAWKDGALESDQQYRLGAVAR